MFRRTAFQLLLACVTIIAILFFAGGLSAQSNDEDAFERVKKIQESHSERLVGKNGIVGTAIGLNPGGQYVVVIMLEKEDVPGVPAHLEGVPVRRFVTGKIYALPKPDRPPGQDKKNPPPAAPIGLDAAAVSNSEIHLTWNPNTEDDLASYNVYRASSSGGPYGLIGSAPKAESPEYSDTSLAAHTAYYDSAMKYRVVFVFGGAFVFDCHRKPGFAIGSTHNAPPTRPKSGPNGSSISRPAS